MTYVNQNVLKRTAVQRTRTVLPIAVRTTNVIRFVPHFQNSKEKTTNARVRLIVIHLTEEVVVLVGLAVLVLKISTIMVEVVPVIQVVAPMLVS